MSTGDLMSPVDEEALQSEGGRDEGCKHLDRRFMLQQSRPGRIRRHLAVWGTHPRIAGGEPNTTNNRMELRAIIAGLEAIKAAAEITVYTDSQYAIGAFTGNKIKKNADLITAGLLKIRSDQEHGRDRDLPARERPCRRSPQRTVRQARPRPNLHPEGSIS